MSKGDRPAIISNISTPSAHQSTLNPEDAHIATLQINEGCVKLQDEWPCVQNCHLISYKQDTQLPNSLLLAERADILGLVAASLMFTTCTYNQKIR